MEKYSIEEIQKKYDALPPKVKGVYESAETAEMLQQIGKEHKLMLDKLGELADETGLIILGLTHPKDYINNLAARLSIEKEEAKQIAEKVNQKVFQKIREELKKIHGIEEGADLETQSEKRKTQNNDNKTPESEKLKPETYPPAGELTPNPYPLEPSPAAPAIKPADTLPVLQTNLPVIVVQPEIITTPDNLKPETPDLQPTTYNLQPNPVSPFEQKLKENEILRSPAKPATAPSPDKPVTPPMPRYSGNDPYREPME
ncbi:MAG: hypothetical protein HZC14_01085 [Candidatus Niyogibacteria bacterium]|nr:hypothetical protein [Candidatus Niyogibacteria bacterium]